MSSNGDFILESCHSYPDTVELDGAWKAARAFDIITFILAIFSVIVVCLETCTTNPRTATTHAWSAPLLLLTALCEGLTLLMFSSKACSSDILLELGDVPLRNVSFGDTCSMSTAAKLTISSTVFWAAGGVTSFFAHRAEKAEIQEEAEYGLREPLNSA